MSEGLCVSLELGSIAQDTSVILLGGVRDARFVRVLSQVGHNPKKAPLKQQLSGAPLERIVCDIMGPVVHSKNGNNYILVVQDYFSQVC